MNKENYRYFCIFGGGAIRGLVYAGAVQALKEKNIEITGYAGSSAGSIAAVMAALGYSKEEMTDIFADFDFMLFKDINFSFKLELAISKGEVFTDKIREIIRKKIDTDKPVTFRDFPKDLYLLTSNISTGECEIFSKETTPDFEVAQAVRISAGFPGLMNPYELNGEYYVDGDLSKPYALSQISPLLNPKDTKILEFRLEGEKKQPPPTNPLAFMNSGIDFLSNSATERVIKTYADKDKYDFVVIETKDTLLFDFSISKEHRLELIELGYNVTKEYFEVTLRKKKKFLIPIYKQMAETVNKAYSYIVKREYKKCKNLMNSYICDNYEIFDLLDENIIGVFNSSAKLLNKYIQKFMFFIPSFDNHIIVRDNLKLLSERLTQKINGLEEYLSEI